LNRGQLKLTQAKFYRISGESTQHKGIIPDIFFPNNFDPESIGESTLDQPLEWDTIKATGYRSTHSILPLVSDLRSMHETRAAADPEFVYLQNALAYRQVRSDIDSVSLNEKTRVREKEESDAFWLRLENDKRQAQGLAVLKSLDELDEDSEPVVAGNKTAQPGISPASDEPAEGIQGNEVAGVVDSSAVSLVPTVPDTDVDETKEVESLPDPFLVETSKIILDLIGLEERIAAEKLEAEHVKL